MDVTSPQIKTFCDAQIRPSADKFAQLYREAKRILAVYEAQGLNTVIPNTEDAIPDGADRDGRPVISGAMVTAFVAGLNTYVQTLEANGNQVLNLVLKVAPNP